VRSFVFAIRAVAVGLPQRH